MKNRWLFPRVTDYFDGRQFNAVYRYSEQIAALPAPMQQQVYAEISARICQMADWAIAKEERAGMIAFSIINDLYRSMNEATYFFPAQSAYLEATAKAYFTRARAQGIIVRFGTNNCFQNPMAATLLFRFFFNCCGFRFLDAYTCALEYRQRIEPEADDARTALSEHRAEALARLDLLVAQANADRVHYAVLIPDGYDTDFHAMLDARSAPGVLTVFKAFDADDPRAYLYPFTAPDSVHGESD